MTHGSHGHCLTLASPGQADCTLLQPLRCMQPCIPMQRSIVMSLDFYSSRICYSNKLILLHCYYCSCRLKNLSFLANLSSRTGLSGRDRWDEILVSAPTSPVFVTVCFENDPRPYHVNISNQESLNSLVWYDTVPQWSDSVPLGLIDYLGLWPFLDLHHHNYNTTTIKIKKWHFKKN